MSSCKITYSLLTFFWDKEPFTLTTLAQGTLTPAIVLGQATILEIK